MTDHIEEAASVGQITGKVGMSQVVDTVAANAGKAEAVTKAFDTAVSKALTAPGSAADVSDARIDLTSESGGAVGREKGDVVSDIARDGAPQAEMDHEARMDDLANRIRGLYSEMTNWQVAWGIAQRTQQDTSQLLRGN